MLAQQINRNHPNRSTHILASSKLKIYILDDLFFFNLFLMKQQLTQYTPNMSFIMGNAKKKYFQMPSRKQKQSNKSNTHSNFGHDAICRKSLDYSIEEGLKAADLSYVKRFQSQECVTMTIDEVRIDKDILVVLSLNIEMGNGQIHAKIDVMKQRNHYFQFETIDERILFNKLILSLKELANMIFKINISILNGRLSLIFPIFTLISDTTITSSSPHKKGIIIRLLLNHIFAGAKQVIETLKKSFRQNVQQDYLGRNLNPLQRLRQMLNIFKGNTNQMMSQSNIQQIRKQQAQSIKRLLSGKRVLDQHTMKLIPLYTQTRQDYQIRNENQCLFNTQETEAFKQIAIPVRLVSKSSAHFSYLLSHIFINKINQLKLRPLKSGGFSTLFLADIEFCFVNPSSKGPNIPKENNWLKNRIIIKKQVPQIGSKFRRNHHQKEIIQKLRSSSSQMLNRYYSVVNSPAGTQNDIIMDFIPFPTLKEYLFINRVSMSLQTKLMLILNVVQAIRSTDAFDVVHLDLKPNNILLNPDLKIKLIDFGQSYHSQVAKHKPGFTIPYASPQVHKRMQKMNVKSDVYSLGILIFQILFKKYPFYPQDWQLKRYKQGTELQLWLYSWQNGQNLGPKNIYQTLTVLISKCLDKDPEKRPQLVVIALVIYHCIKLLS